MKLKVTLIGAGNVATHLAKALWGAGCEIRQVYSRTTESAKQLAQIYNSGFTNNPKKIYSGSDIYFVLLKDSVFDEILSEINFNKQLLVHCSGSLPLEMLKKYSTQIGVFYPLQTFSKNKDIDFKKVPVFIEGNSEKSEKLLLKLGKLCSENVTILNSRKRKTLHISAVFASNFVNYFYSIAAEILEKDDIDFNVLQELVFETARKAFFMKPKNAQTGPAVRFDEIIINEHLKQLSQFPHHQELYNSVSKSIFEFYKKHD